MNERKKVVVFGGGTGITNLLDGLKLFPVDITAVITVSDDGRSTGKLRREFKMPAIGDLRKVIVSLAEIDPEIKKLLEYRFDTYSDLDGHPVGNLILAGMYNMTGSLKDSTEVLSKFLGVSHKVLPLSDDYLTLVGEADDGTFVYGECNLVSSDKIFEDFSYKEQPKVLPEVIDAVKEASLIIFSMGSLFTSVLPHLLSNELVSAINSVDVPIMYLSNAVMQVGETEGFSVSDHLKVLNKYLGNSKVDVVIAADSSIDQEVLDKYVNSEHKHLVKIDEDKIKELSCELIKADLLKVENGYIRHDTLKLATKIFNYLMR